jgi:hypothetical protein
MRKPVGLLILILSTAVLLTATNQSFINRIKQDRYFDHLIENPGKRTFYRNVFVRSDRWRYGDLYGLCYLPQFKLRLEPFRTYNVSTTRSATGRVLYLIGDSFLADKTLTYAFDQFDNVVFLDRRFPFGPIHLDSTRQNYLLLEFAERNLNNYSQESTSEVKWTMDDLKARRNFQSNITPQPAGTAEVPTLAERINKIIFNKDLSRNLELLLFDDRMFTPVKELKASLNYQLFGRVAKEVAVSTDEHRLLLNITVDTADIHSSFRPKTQTDIDSITSHLTSAEKYYRSIGFKQVFLSIIPNPVSIYDNKRMPYNHLLERVEKQSTVPAMSVMNVFRYNNRNLYYRSDAHWNPAGFELWVNRASYFFARTVQ